MVDQLEVNRAYLFKDKDDRYSYRLKELSILNITDKCIKVLQGTDEDKYFMWYTKEDFNNCFTLVEAL